MPFDRLRANGWSESVVASDKTQYVDIGYYLALCPWGYIDDYEGNVYRYSPGKGGGREMISQSGQ
jgi:hypothetical protein